MIVRPDQLEAIRAGKKTRVRFWVAKGERECTYKPNRSYGVRSSWIAPADQRVTVTQVRRERLGEATHRDAKREGHRTVQELHAEWGRELDREMWVILFVLGDQTDRPRLLAARSGTSLGDYTEIPSRAMRGEPEAVPDAAQKAITAKARKRYEEGRMESWGEQRDRLLAVIQEIRQAPASRSVNESLRGVERQVASLDRKLKTTV
jgi:hypothetical protein